MHLLYKSQFAAICLLLFCGFISPAAAQNGLNNSVGTQATETQEWKRYTVKDEEFSVLFPIGPMMKTSTTTIAVDKERRVRKLAAYADGVVYTVFAYEKKMLTIDDLVGKVTQRESAITNSVTVSGITGKSFKNEDADRMREVQLFATKKNLYVFQALGSKLGNPAIGISKFLSSISFDKDPEGIKVEDGPGDRPASNSTSNSEHAGIFRSSQVSSKAVVVIKPEPRYTESARRNQVVGTVVLRCVFSSSGVATNIAVVGSLPEGLTERAIGAAKQIRFIPAIKDGRFVSMWMQLEYNFNLY